MTEFTKGDKKEINMKNKMKLDKIQAKMKRKKERNLVPHGEWWEDNSSVHRLQLLMLLAPKPVNVEISQHHLV